MRRNLLNLFLLIPIFCFSQNTSTVTITTEQLRTANQIFLEHQKFSEQIPLYQQQIVNLEAINSSWEKTDSIRKVEYYKMIEEKNRAIENLNKSLKKKQDIISFGGMGVATIAVLCLLLK